MALGLSSSAWPLLQRLLVRKHVDQLALTPGAASTVDFCSDELIIADARTIFRRNWKKGGLFIVVGSIGAVTRSISSLISNKEEDPAIIVLDADANHVVPLIGGHKAGAEYLAIQLAADLGGKAVITGDCQTQGRMAIDCFWEAWGWKRSGCDKDWRQVMVDQSQGKKLFFEQQSGSEAWQNLEVAKDAFSTNPDFSTSKRLLIGPFVNDFVGWHPPTLWIGVGCERNTTKNLIERGLREALSKGGFSEDAIAGLASIDVKGNEESLLYLSDINGWPLKLYCFKELAEVSVPNPSEIVLEQMGTASVAEASALLAAAEGGCLHQGKMIFHAKNNNESGAVTIAIAESVNAFAPQKGELHLIGSGPGDISMLTQDARKALARSAVWFGYERYLELLEPIRRKDQVRIDGRLTLERERCLQALRFAQQGIRVALVSSGDCGIYGMAGLLLELWLQEPEDSRPKFEVHPGLSAFQIAASKVGAPLMHDFCSVSLSDRLTPWDKIESRLIAAAKADFVVALYNPKSKGRSWQLNRAIEIFLEYRSVDNPLVLAHQLSRPQEKVQIKTLGSISFDEVDMLTIIVIGNSATRYKDGLLVTPRGYNVDKTLMSG